MSTALIYSEMGNAMGTIEVDNTGHMWEQLWSEEAKERAKGLDLYGVVGTRGGGGGGQVINGKLGREVPLTLSNPDAIQDTNMHISLPCLRQSALICDPVQDWEKLDTIQDRNINTKRSSLVRAQNMIEFF